MSSGEQPVLTTEKGQSTPWSVYISRRGQGGRVVASSGGRGGGGTTLDHLTCRTGGVSPGTLAVYSQ